MINTLSVFLRCVLDKVVWGKLKQFRQSVDLAVVGVELLELDCFGVVCVNELEDSLDLVTGKGIVQPPEDLLKLLNSQFSALVSVIGVEGLIQSKFL